ncbi:MAG TPA: hypothetical protein VN764_12640, partial [Polyangiaceae bacterium]|nr:hypothetical protein [Polyangiaceae bacterium]
LSPWLDVLVSSTAGDKEARLPKLGNQVGCLLDERGESGCVLCAVYSSVDAPPDGMTVQQRILQLEDGAKFAYDQQDHTLRVKCEHVEVGEEPDFVALAGPVKDEFDRVKQDIQTLKNQTYTAINAVGVGIGANGPAAATSFQGATSSIPSSPGEVKATVLKAK